MKHGSWKTVAWLFGLLSLASIATGCSGLARQQFYDLEAKGGRSFARPMWVPSGPELVLDSETQGAHVHLRVGNHATRGVLAGPLILWVIPTYLVNWIWAEPLQESPLSIHVQVRATKAQLTVDPTQMTLRAADGQTAPQVRTSIEELERPNICLFEESERKGPLPIEDWNSTYALLEFDVSNISATKLELSLGGILVDGNRQDLPIVHIRRAKGWTTWAEPH